MSDSTEDGGKAMGKKGAGESGSGVNGQIGRMLVRAIWSQEWSAANPGATLEARKAAWQEARPLALEKNFKSCRRAIAILQRSGVTMTLNKDATTARAESDSDDDSDD